MRFPDFLIVGAMKAGTTSLYRDLLTNPEIFFPLDKEPGHLCNDDVLTPAGRSAYAALFRSAKPNQLVGEASTAYTKRPDVQGCAERARAVCGPDLKVIYLVRDPVERIISHHHHRFALSGDEPDIDTAVRERPMYINYSRYAWQIEPWVEQFKADNVRIIEFKNYIEHRREIVGSLSEFLGVTPRPNLVETDTVYNQTVGRRIVPRRIKWMQRSLVYRWLVRPLLPTNLRERAIRAALPEAPARPRPPKPETRRAIVAALAEDQDRLRRLLRSLDVPSERAAPALRNAEAHRAPTIALPEQSDQPGTGASTAGRGGEWEMRE